MGFPICTRPNWGAMPPKDGNITGCSAGAAIGAAEDDAGALLDDAASCPICWKRAKSSGLLCCAACNSSSVARLIAMAASRLHDIILKRSRE